ncbi:MAG: hypothetical protein E7502_07070 [Ruminococcus sp.]|jgi:hypothetical protein|nr:hypothetical protein [Ruminococcus sp.]
MNKRAIRFILALTTLTVLVWGVGELLIAEFINSYKVSLGWGIFCLVACLAYSVWKCPWDIGKDEDDK